jgi:predicted XRE-type DNA-binding protein
MDEAKQHRLKRAGWRPAAAADFLELSPEEAAFVELKLALGDYLRLLRTQNSWTQAQVAGRLRSSQSRVAKMEAADASVSVDLLVRSLLALGASRQEVGGVIAQAA